VGNIHRKDYYSALIQEPKLTDWIWLIAFFVICTCNGWFLRASSATLPLVICFAIFPLTFILYEIFNHTLILQLSLVVSWGILAFAIANLDLPSLSTIAIILYGLNILFFAFVLLDTISDNGLFMLFFITAITLLLFRITNWETILRLVWYCNLMIITTNAGARLNKYLQSFFAAMLTLTGTAGLGLTLGWFLGGISFSFNFG
jgi:hypothetical protein